MRVSTRVPVFTFVFVLSACRGPESVTPRHAVTITAESDPGVPLRGVAFDVDGTDIGTSDASGLVHTILEGREGTTVDIHHLCPDGYRSDDDTQSLALIAFESVGSEAPAGLRMSVRCTPTTRQVGFVVRTAAGPTAIEDLPVRVNGRELARTDSSGLAHIVMSGTPGESFRVQVATDGVERLGPDDPTESFTLGASSQIFYYEPALELSAPPPRRRRPRRRTPTIMRIIRLN